MDRYRSGHNGPDSKSGSPAMGSWVRIPPCPPQKVGNFDRNCLPFLFARKPLISGLFRYPATKKQPLRSYFRSGIFTFRVFPAPLSRTNRSHRGVLFNLRGIVLTVGNRSICGLNHLRNLTIYVCWPQCLKQSVNCPNNLIGVDSSNKGCLH